MKITNETDDLDHPFRAAQSVAELALLGDKFVGRELGLMILQAAELPKQTLERAARDLKRGGEVELSGAVLALSKSTARAKRRDMRPGRWRCPSVDVWLKQRRTEG